MFIFTKKFIFFSSTFLVKIIHILSYSISSTISSCKDFLYNLSKNLTSCWSFSYCFFSLFYLFMINICNTLLFNVRVQALPADIGKIIKPTPVFGKVFKVDVVPIITNLSTDSNNLFIVL